MRQHPALPFRVAGPKQSKGYLDNRFVNPRRVPIGSHAVDALKPRNVHKPAFDTIGIAYGREFGPGRHERVVDDVVGLGRRA